MAQKMKRIQSTAQARLENAFRDMDRTRADDYAAGRSNVTQRPRLAYNTRKEPGRAVKINKMEAVPDSRKMMVRTKTNNKKNRT